MPIISVRDNENNRWNRNSKKQTKTEKKRGGGTEAIVKEWAINDFVVHLNLVFSNFYVKLL